MGIAERLIEAAARLAGGGVTRADLRTDAPDPVHPPRRVVALIAGPNPSFDYFLAPRAAVDRDLAWEIVDTRRVRPGSVDLSDAYVLICRYLGPAWRAGLLARRDRLAGVGLFLDDDFVAFVADDFVPAAYRLRVAAVGLAAWKPLAPVLSRVWFSSAGLAASHPGARGFVLTPAPSPIDLAPPTTASAPPAAANGPPRIGFHAKSSHLAEHRFAAQVAARVLEVLPEARFDVIATGAARRAWAGLPRVEIAGTIPWPRYRALGAGKRLDILISPLVPSALNEGRSPTKAIDAVRFGAAGLFADHPVHADLSTAGALLPPVVEAWVEAIVALGRDPSARRHAADRLRAVVSSWRDGVEPLEVPGTQRRANAAAAESEVDNRGSAKSFGRR